MGSLFSLRENDLGELAPKLAPFIVAYRPHGEIPKLKMLREEGYERIEKESFLDEFEELYFSEHGYYPDEKPDLQLSEPAMM
jgi:hypothetical protein